MQQRCWWKPSLGSIYPTVDVSKVQRCYEYRAGLSDGGLTMTIRTRRSRDRAASPIGEPSGVRHLVDCRNGGAARRRGVTLVAAIVALLVAMLVATTLVRTIVIHRRQTRAEIRQLQAFWLADSGYRLAATKLRSDPKYSGGPWRVSLGSADRREAGMVLVEIEPQGVMEADVVVTATWPDVPTYRSSYQRLGTLPITSQENPSDVE